MRSGYAGKIQIGVIFSIVKDAVDHLRTFSVYDCEDSPGLLT